MLDKGGSDEINNNTHKEETGKDWEINFQGLWEYLMHLFLGQKRMVRTLFLIPFLWIRVVCPRLPENFFSFEFVLSSAVTSVVDPTSRA